MKIFWALGLSGCCLLLALGLRSRSPLLTTAQPASIPAQGVKPTPTAVDSLPALARSTLDHYFATGQVLSVPDPLPQEWQRSSGLFVTLSLEGQTRGCWGTIQATAPNLALATIRAVIGAATRDWRYPPLKASELSQIAIQVAIVHDIHPIDSVTQLDPTRSGLLIRSGNQGAVLLPGEALTPQWQLSTARQLAGIPPQAPVHLFRVEAELIHEFSP